MGRRKAAYREKVIVCDCGAKKLLRTGTFYYMNNKGREQFRDKAETAAQLVGFSWDGRCVRVRFDGERTPHTMAFSFFHQGTFTHDTWEKQVRGS